MSPSDPIGVSVASACPRRLAAASRSGAAASSADSGNGPPSPSAKVVDPCHPAAWAAPTNELPALAPSSEAVAIAFTARTSSPITGSSLPMRAVGCPIAETARSAEAPANTKAALASSIRPSTREEAPRCRESRDDRSSRVAVVATQAASRSATRARIPRSASDQRTERRRHQGRRGGFTLTLTSVRFGHFCGGLAPRRHHGSNPSGVADPPGRGIAVMKGLPRAAGGGWYERHEPEADHRIVVLHLFLFRPVQRGRRRGDHRHRDAPHDPQDAAGQRPLGNRDHDLRQTEVRARELQIGTTDPALPASSGARRWSAQR